MSADDFLQKKLFFQDALWSVDTRTLQKGDVFVALQGQAVDGHDFVQEALRKGASGFVLAQQKKAELLAKFGEQLAEKKVLFVTDTLQTLVAIAHHWRLQFSYPVVAITGSVGKTTTKEMVKSILEASGKKYLVSSGNQNTLVGVALNILKMQPEHEVAVFEVGIGVIGAMQKIVQLLWPTCAVITKIGHAHMQGLGDLQAVAREKLQVFSYFSQNNMGIINGDQPELSDVLYTHPVLRFGRKKNNQIQASKVVVAHNTTSFVVKIHGASYPVIMQGCHEARVYNALAAISVGYALGIDPKFLLAGISKPLQVPGRFEVLQHHSGSILINDAYNANPDSVKAALLALQAYETDKEKIVVLGDMLELGEDSLLWHRRMGRFLHKVNDVSQVILIGQQARVMQETLPCGVTSVTFGAVHEAFDFLKQLLLQKNKVFLFKASHGVNLVGIIKQLQNS